MPSRELEKAIPACRLARERFSRSFGRAFPHRFHQALGEKAHRLYGMDVGQGGGRHGEKGFHGVTEGIGGGGADIFVGEGFERVRVGEADVGRHAAAHDGHLAAPFRCR